MRKGTLVKGGIGAAAAVLAGAGIGGLDGPQQGAVATHGGEWGSQPQSVGIETTEPAVHPRIGADAVIAEMGKHIEGFGGFFFGPDGALVVNVKDPAPARVAEIEASISRVLSGDRQFQQARIELRQCQYTYEELREWHDRIFARADALPGLVSTAANETTNRVVIGVESTEARALVEQELAELGIPDSAVVFKIRGPTELYLADWRRPFVGGQQIEMDWTPGNYGTLGFYAQRDETDGFVTVMHATPGWGIVDGTVFHQPTIGGNNSIGTEAVDPPFSDEKDICPPGGVCRWSDSIWAKSNQQSHAPGEIAQAALGFPVWDGVGTWRIVDEGTPWEGDFVIKVGRTSGTTGAYVTEGCANEVYLDDGPGGLPTLWLLCQVEVDREEFAYPGDSGSPVFKQTGQGNDVELVGMFVGARGDNDVRYFSQIGGILSDLGTLKTCWDLSC